MGENSDIAYKEEPLIDPLLSTRTQINTDASSGSDDRTPKTSAEWKAFADQKTRKKKPAVASRSRHDGHFFCGFGFCLDHEQAERMCQQIKAAGGEPNDADLKEFLAEQSGLLEDETEKTHEAPLWIWRRFSAMLKTEFGGGK